MTTGAAIKSDPNVESDEKDPWVNLNVASGLRGMSRNTVLLEALDGKIRHLKVAGRRVFHRGDIAGLVKAGAAPPDAAQEND